MKKKQLIVAGILVLVGVGGGLLFNFRSKSASNTSPPEVTNIVLPVNQRPFLTLTPSRNPLNGQVDGKFYVMTITNKVNGEQVDFELTYETATVPRGTVGKAEFVDGVYKREDFFGTKSTKDYHFDTGVEYGKVLLTVVSPSNEYEIEANFRLQTVGPQGQRLSDRNQTFELIVPKGAVSKKKAVISQQTVGLPGAYSANFLIGQPVAFLSEAATVLNQPAVLRIKVDKKPEAKVIIVGWDEENNQWKEFETSFDEESLTAVATVDY